MALLGCPRVHTVPLETRGLSPRWILTLEPERSATGGPHEQKSRPPMTRCAQAACVFRCSASNASPIFQMDTYPRTRALSDRRTARTEISSSDDAMRSSCLCLQMLGVKRFSFLPNRQRNRGDLARQRQPRHRRQHPFVEKSLIKNSERTFSRAGRRCRTLEQILQLVAVVEIQSADEYRLASAYQLPILKAIISGRSRLQRQPAVSPELTLGAEAVRRLHFSDQQRRADRSQKRNGAQPLHGFMLATLQNQLLTRFAAQRLQDIELLIKEFGATV